MIRNILKGALAGWVVSSAYNWQASQKSFPNGVPLGNIVQPRDAGFLIIGIGALAGAVFLRKA